MAERQLTTTPHGHLLTNVNVFSPDGAWIVADVRSDRDGSVFDGARIEAISVETGEVHVLYRARNGARCGVATMNPVADEAIFILGPEHPDAAWSYAAPRRQGVIVPLDGSGGARNLDARDIVPPFTPGALRGGSHVHVFSPNGRRASFTYEDAVLDDLGRACGRRLNRRTIGVSELGRPVRPPEGPRNHAAEAFTVVVAETVEHPAPGSDEIGRAYEEGWIGSDRLAFIGDVTTADGCVVPEIFVVDLPADLTRRGSAGPLEGTATTPPAPPADTRQRRVTRSAGRPFPGVGGVRHWLRGAPDGSAIAFLASDDRGVPQLCLVSPEGGEIRRLTSGVAPVDTAFTWDPAGRFIVHGRAGALCLTEVATARTDVLVPPRPEAPLLPHAVCTSPDGRRLAYLRRVNGDTDINRVFLADIG